MPTLSWRRPDVAWRESHPIFSTSSLQTLCFSFTAFNIGCYNSPLLSAIDPTSSSKKSSQLAREATSGTVTRTKQQQIIHDEIIIKEKG
jgi:hypothetical protein